MASDPLHRTARESWRDVASELARYAISGRDAWSDLMGPLRRVRMGRWSSPRPLTLSSWVPSLS